MFAEQFDSDLLDDTVEADEDTSLIDGNGEEGAPLEDEYGEADAGDAIKNWADQAPDEEEETPNEAEGMSNILFPEEAEETDATDDPAEEGNEPMEGEDTEAEPEDDGVLEGMAASAQSAAE